MKLCCVRKSVTKKLKLNQKLCEDKIDMMESVRRCRQRLHV